MAKKKSSKKPTIQQRNESLRDSLLKQKVSTTKGFLKSDFKNFVIDEMINAANRQKKALRANTSVQKRYEQFQTYYDKLFTSGLTGHAQFTGQIERQAKRDMEKGIQYYIKEKGKERKVGISELAYKMELTAHKLSANYDIAFTKFKPVYFLLGKGKYKIVITIPDMKEFEEDGGEEMTVEDIMEWFDNNRLSIVVSDPANIKGDKAKKKHAEAVKNRKNKIKKAKEKYYKRWKAGAKAAETKQKKSKASKKKRK